VIYHGVSRVEDRRFAFGKEDKEQLRTYMRMYMQGLMPRFTQWFNRKHGHNGGLWEDAFKSVPVEDGVASRTMAAYIDLNPVRAGMRSSGARKLRGNAAAAAGLLWSVRDLQKGIGRGAAGRIG
jgi:putative transposase